MELGGIFAMIPALLIGTDKYDIGQYFEFKLPYFQDNLYMMMVMGAMSNRRLSQVISADYLRRKYLPHSAVNDADAHYIGWHRRLSRAYFSSAMTGLK